MLRDITNFLVAAGPWGLLLLAIIDSAGLPVANGLDAYLIFLSVKEPDRAYHYAAISVAGSVAGNVILYLVARRGGRRFQQRVEPDKKHRFRRWFERFGLVTVFVPAFIPIPMPLKLFVISAGALRTRFLWFLTVIVLARIPRYFGEAWLGAKMGRESSRFLKEHVWHFAAGAIILFGVLYLLVIANDRWRRRRRPALQ